MTTRTRRRLELIEAEIKQLKRQSWMLHEARVRQVGYTRAILRRLGWYISKLDQSEDFEARNVGE
jgi:hypothetical protein